MKHHHCGMNFCGLIMAAVHEEYCVEEALMACGHHIKILAFPSCRVASTLVNMLKYCENVKYFSMLPSSFSSMHCEHLIKLALQQLPQLQVLEIYYDANNGDSRTLLSITSSLKELTLHSCSPQNRCFQLWLDAGLRPSDFNVVMHNYDDKVIPTTTKLLTIDHASTANFRLYMSSVKECFNFSAPGHAFPYLQIHFTGSCGQAATTCVKLSDFGILGLKDDLAVVADYQCGGRMMHSVKCDYHFVNILKASLHISRLNNIACITHFVAN